MNNAVSRRALILAASLLGIAWAGLAEANPASFTVALSGAQAVPALETAGKGTADLTYDAATRVVTWDITYSGMSSAVTMAHFHNAPQGKNGPVVIWLTTKGVSPAGPIKGETTLTPAQAKEFLAGDWYVNVHTTAHPAGEIRGQVVPPKG